MIFIASNYRIMSLKFIKFYDIFDDTNYRNSILFQDFFIWHFMYIFSLLLAVV